MKFIGINRLWYTAPLSAVPTIESLVTLLNATTTKEVKNSHNGTFQYTHDDPEVTDYINELNGKIYHRDKTSNGKKTITFSVGEYDLDNKAELQGGTVSTEGVWASGDNDELIYKAVVAQTKTGNFIIFTNASITAKVDTQEKALALGVTAVAMDNESDGVKDEYWASGASIEYNKETKKFSKKAG